jgi:hypothetical protein
MFRKFGVPHLDRPAEYFDLPLTDQALAPGEALKRDYPNIFASTYRYRTPELEGRLVDASEELSARVSMLRSLFPHLLGHYESILDFYQRWVDWIEEYNDQRRPGTFFRHQAEAEDLLDFITQEMKRLNITSGALMDLVRYERMKLDARYVSGPKNVGVPMVEAITQDSLVDHNTGFLVAEFDHDIQALLGKQEAAKSQANGRRWVVVYKTADDQLTTLQVSGRTKELLELAKGPIRVGDLIVASPFEAVAREANLAAVQTLTRIGLLGEVRPS